MTGKTNEWNAEIARRLSELDLSDESHIRESLGGELSRRIDSLRPGGENRDRQFWRWSMFRRPLPAFVLGIVVALAALTLALPDTRAALSNLVKVFKVGDHTEIIEGQKFDHAVIDSILTDHDAAVERGEAFLLMNDYGGFGGGVPPGEDPFVKQTGSLSLAAGMVDYPLMVPTYYHERIPARLRFQKAQITPGGTALLYFGVGPYETMLSQSPVGEGRSIGMSTGIMTATADGKMAMESNPAILEEIDVGGMPVVWSVHDEIMRRQLGGWAAKDEDTVIGKFVWEVDGVSYILDGKFLTKDEGIKIIKSLRPVGGKE